MPTFTPQTNFIGVQANPAPFSYGDPVLAGKAALAQALYGQGASTAPIYSPWEGVARLGAAGLGGWLAGNTAEEAREKQQAAFAELGKFLGSPDGTDLTKTFQFMSGNPYTLPLAQKVLETQIGALGKGAEEKYKNPALIERTLQEAWGKLGPEVMGDYLKKGLVPIPDPSAPGGFRTVSVQNFGKAQGAITGEAAVSAAPGQAAATDIQTPAAARRTAATDWAGVAPGIAKDAGIKMNPRVDVIPPGGELGVINPQAAMAGQGLPPIGGGGGPAPMPQPPLPPSVGTPAPMPQPPIPAPAPQVSGIPPAGISGAAGLAPGAYTPVARSTQPGPGTPEGALQKTVGEDAGKLPGQWRAEASSAMTLKNNAAQMRSMISQGLETGAGAELTASVGNVLQSIFKVDPALVEKAFQTGDKRAFQSMANDMAKAMMGGSLGAGFSNADRDFVLSMVPQLRDNPQAIIKIMDRLESAADRQIAKFVQGYTAYEQGVNPMRFELDWAQKHGLVAPSIPATPQGPTTPVGGLPKEVPQGGKPAVTVGTIAVGKNGERRQWNGTDWVPIK